MQKLPAILCIKHALNSVFNFREAGMRIALPWILTLAAISTIDLLFFGAADVSTTAPAQSMEARPTDFLMAVISMVSLASIAVNWHRYILRDEVTASNKIFRLDAIVWKYVGRSVLIVLSALVGVIVISALIWASAPILFPLIAIPLFLAAVYIMRMSVSLPAVALERKDFGIKDALKATQGNNWQFVGLTILNTLVFLCVFAVLAVLLTIAGNINTALLKVSVIMLGIPANLFLSLYSISLWSSLYGFFVEGRKY